mgnify:CR=1 FL=1
MRSNTVRTEGVRRGAIPRGIATKGPALLSYGFRPFFLGAGLFAIFAMVAWIGALTQGWEVGGRSYGAILWHGHEMLFGYATAALAGFMLTAIPNWTGRLPVSGMPLLGLVLLWLTGRIAMLQPDMIGLYPAVVVDAAFLPALACIAGREIIAGRNWKNLKILIALGLLTGSNLAFHLQVLSGGDTAPVLRAAIAALVVLIGLVGGRIIPSFTRNWLVKNGAAALPRPHGRLDVAAMAALIVALAVWVLVPDSPLVVASGTPATVLLVIRLASWRGYAAFEEPLLVALHVAYAFLPIGLLGVVLAAMGWLSQPSALHIFTVGAIGSMTLAVMTRATLGHTGRKLAASGWTSASYLALLIAAVVRPFAELLPQHYHELLGVSGVCWIAAFGLFSIEYGRLLVAPKRA